MRFDVKKNQLLHEGILFLERILNLILKGAEIQSYNSVDVNVLK